MSEQHCGDCNCHLGVMNMTCVCDCHLSTSAIRTDGIKVTNNFELTLPNQQRKGQYLHNTILGIKIFSTPQEEQSYILQKLFHMSDTEFDKIMSQRTEQEKS